MQDQFFPRSVLSIPTDQHTLGHLDCPACEKAKNMTLTRISPQLTFSTAAALWLDSRSFKSPSIGFSSARFIRDTTEKSYRQYVKTLNLFFEKLPLEKIHLGHMREYQEARVTGSSPFIRRRRPNKNVLPAPCPASPKKANQELSILKMILRRAGCWTPEMDEFYQPFREDLPDMPRALTAEEQCAWLQCANSIPRWHLVYWYSVLAFDTGMSTNEIRALRLGDVDIAHRLINIPAQGAKNRYRQRSVTLNTPEVIWAVEQLVRRSQDLGANSPLHYLFPFRRPPREFDPILPMTASGIKRQWNEVRSAVGLRWLRPYDTRHTAITRWAEACVPPAVIKARAGHVSDRMMLHYTHIYEAVQRWELDKVPRIGPLSAGAPFYVQRQSC